MLRMEESLHIAPLGFRLLGSRDLGFRAFLFRVQDTRSIAIFICAGKAAVAGRPASTVKANAIQIMFPCIMNKNKCTSNDSGIKSSNMMQI